MSVIIKSCSSNQIFLEIIFIEVKSNFYTVKSKFCNKPRIPPIWKKNMNIFFKPGHF